MIAYAFHNDTKTKKYQTLQIWKREGVSVINQSDM